MLKEDLLCREITEGDVRTVQQWLEGWGMHPIEAGMYPSTGLLLYEKKKLTPIYMGFVWTSNSRMAQVGFITRNPFFKEKLPRGVRKDFVLGLIQYTKDLGYEYVITWTDNSFLVGDFKALGMTETSNRCSELIGRLL